MRTEAVTAHLAIRRRLKRLLVACLVGSALLVFLPINGLIDAFVAWLHQAGRSVGAPAFLTPHRYEFGLNMLLFAVPTAVAVILWPEISRWRWLVVALATSTTIELLQYLALPRVADLTDVVANVMGAALGVAAVSIFGQPALSPASEPDGTVRVRGLPGHVETALKLRAAHAGLPLEDYLREELVRLARPASRSELIERIRSRETMPLPSAAEELRLAREARG